MWARSPSLASSAEGVLAAAGVLAAVAAAGEVTVAGCGFADNWVLLLAGWPWWTIVGWCADARCSWGVVCVVCCAGRGLTAGAVAGATLGGLEAAGCAGVVGGELSAVAPGSLELCGGDGTAAVGVVCPLGACEPSPLSTIGASVFVVDGGSMRPVSLLPGVGGCASGGVGAWAGSSMPEPPGSNSALCDVSVGLV